MNMSRICNAKTSQVLLKHTSFLCTDVLGSYHVVDHDELGSQVFVDGEDVEEAETEDHDVDCEDEACCAKTTEVVDETKCLKKKQNTVKRHKK